MGLGHSKAHPRVIKVTPLQSQQAETPSTGPVFFPLNRYLEEKSPFSRLQDQSRIREGQLPPLRETWYGRLPAVSRAMYLDIPLKHEETSIIKRHPPRRIQKLEPIDLPQAITSERLLCQQEARTKPNAKENEKKIQLPMYTSGKRQYLHKMKMLEMNHKRQEAQMELRKSLLSKAMLDMQKLKDHNGNKITQSKPRSKGYDILTILPDENINRDPGSVNFTMFMWPRALQRHDMDTARGKALTLESKSLLSFNSAPSLEEIPRMKNSWTVTQRITIMSGKLAKWKHGSVNKKPGDSFSGTVPALTLMSLRKMRGDHKHW
ncbi:uncharacterized protein CCDC198 isoform X2 [Mus pahari]|uniref:uncharacterized protein CCDC198 isoform X2 n=1 Tax=Mus pahari TaxID=10093 RepID=UPI0011149C84|nr:uncharacterized protein CCDC198 isoform X2 [Mus pahari]